MEPDEVEYHVIPGRKYVTKLRILDPLNSFTSYPSSAQLITYSLLPYQRLNAPPLLYGTHF